MKIISFNDISEFQIPPIKWVEWVEWVFKNKYNYTLPTKISISMPGDVFYNVMPSYIPDEYKIGTKIVTRYPNNNPSLRSEILLYDSNNGNLLGLIDGTWITTMRTGAVAALSIKTLEPTNAKEYAFIGLGNTARATLLCLLSIFPKKHFKIRLYAYKKQEAEFINRFKDYQNIDFTIFESYEELISGADVVISCVTAAKDLFASDSCFKKGVLVVPVHTRGFQNCDLFFDKVFADDTGHVSGFKYFDKFKLFDELSNVLLNKNTGRENDNERILAYNIGISIHDIYIASKIFELFNQNSKTILNLPNPFDIRNKFWL